MLTPGSMPFARLEAEIAYSAAASDIEIYCHSTRQADGSLIYDTTRPSAHIHRYLFLSTEDSAFLRRSIAYLELRGLLQRDPDAMHLVRILPPPHYQDQESP